MIISDNFSPETADGTLKKGISFELCSVPAPAGDFMLLQETVKRLQRLMEAVPNLGISYCWKKEEGHPARFWAFSSCAIGYFAIGQAVVFAQNDLLKAIPSL